MKLSCIISKDKLIKQLNSQRNIAFSTKEASTETKEIKHFSGTYVSLCQKNVNLCKGLHFIEIQEMSSHNYLLPNYLYTSVARGVVSFHFCFSRIQFLSWKIQKDHTVLCYNPNCRMSFYSFIQALSQVISFYYFSLFYQTRSMFQIFINIYKQR